MVKLSLDRAKKIAYEKIGIDLDDENRPIILEEFTLDFDWGFVFYYEGKKAIETNNFEYGYIGNVPILVDKINGEANYVGGIGKILDADLENYREQKGYPNSIKFPVQENIANKPIIEKAKALFRTGEILQIKKGVKLLEENLILDLVKFKNLIFNSAFPNWTFEEMIAAQFESEELVLNNGIGNEFPDELEIFKDITSISLSGAKLKSISDDILKLPKLKSIIIWYSEIEEITSRIFELKFLERIEIWDSNLGLQAHEIIEQLRLKNNVRVE